MPLTNAPWPGHTPTRSRPASRIAAAIRSSASSQPIGSHWSEPRGPTRCSGRSSRRGLASISCAAWPRTHRNPRLSGFSGSPLTLLTRPSSTVTTIPQKVGWQFIGHIVLTVWTCSGAVLMGTSSGLLAPIAQLLPLEPRRRILDVVARQDFTARLDEQLPVFLRRWGGWDAHHRVLRVGGDDLVLGADEVRWIVAALDGADTLAHEVAEHDDAL